MTPQEKANQLVEKYRTMIKYDSIYDIKWRNPFESKENHRRATKDAKMYAIVAANEVIEQEKHWINSVKKGNSTYWNEVKKEIEKL